MTKVYRVFSKIGNEFFYRIFASAKEAEKQFDEELEKLKQIAPSSVLRLREYVPISFDDQGTIKYYSDLEWKNRVELNWFKVY